MLTSFVIKFVYFKEYTCKLILLVICIISWQKLHFQSNELQLSPLPTNNESMVVNLLYFSKIFLWANNLNGSVCFLRPVYFAHFKIFLHNFQGLHTDNSEAFLELTKQLIVKGSYVNYLLWKDTILKILPY